MKEPSTPSLPEGDAPQPAQRGKRIIIPKQRPNNLRIPRAAAPLRPGASPRPCGVASPAPSRHALASSSPQPSTHRRNPIGKPDFSRNILPHDPSLPAKRDSQSSSKQRLFFDAAVAVAAVSFTVLVFIRL